jgi:tonB-linked outer membrane protein, susC/ragA family
MRKSVLSLLLLFLALGVAWAQKRQITVSGTVVSSYDKEPVVAASVVCTDFPGTGSLTDVNGRFSFKVPAEARTLTISCIGYTTQKVPITEGAMNIILKSEERVTETVVVTGYGATRKSAFTGSATTVSTKGLKDVPSISLEDKLTGAIAGVNVNSLSGQPGSFSTVRIRGLGSINAGNSPLYVIDGVPVNMDNATIFNYGGSGGVNPLSTLNTNDIENVTVIKDAGAAALYGSRAANGVIVITTKSGRSGSTRYNFKSDWGFSDIAIDYRPTLSGEERKAVIESGFRNYYSTLTDGHGQLLYPTPDLVEAEVQKATAGSTAVPWTGHYTDWRKILLRRGGTQNYEFSAMGGGDKTRFYTSISYSNQKGISASSGFNRLTGAFNVSHTDRRLELKARMLFAKTNQDKNSERSSFANPIFGVSTTLSPSTFPYNPDGSYSREFPGNNGLNPLFALQKNFMRTKITRANPTLEATFTIFPWLKAKQIVSYDYLNTEEAVWWDPRQGDGEAANGVFQRVNGETGTLTTQSQLYAQKQLDKHNLSGVASFETEQYDYLQLYAYGLDYPSHLKYEIENSGTQSSSSSILNSRMLSFLLKGDYDYDGRYIFGASARWDGSSRLAPAKRWGLFWSLSGSWNIGKEDFMKPIDHIISDTRLRLSYGANGTLPSGLYDHLSRYGFGYNYNGGTGLKETSLGSPNLSWEKNKALNIGLDFRLLHRLSFTLDFYTRKTTDLLLYKAISGTTGFSSELQNLGSMRNTGFEIEIRSNNLSFDGFSWNTTLSVGHNKNELLRYDGVQTREISGNWIHEVGHPYNTYYLAEYAGVDPQTGKASYYKNTLNNKGELDRTITTDINKVGLKRIDDKPFDPVVTGGIMNTINWGIIDLSINFSYSLGGYLYDDAVGLHKDGNTEVLGLAVPKMYDLNKMWKKPGDKAELPAFNPTNEYIASTRFLLPSDHLRLKNLTLGITVPKKWTTKLGVNTLRAYASGTNLLTWKDKRVVVDPEGRGFIAYQTPALRTITFGVQVGI